jgi:hypothetical protein
MLIPISQNEGVTERERYLVSLARNKLFRLWSYPGLSRREADGRSQELADLTVVFGDDLILFSDKDEAWPNHPDVDIAWRRWYRKSISKSANQLWGAERYLRQFPDCIYLDAKLAEPFPFPIITERTRIHLVAVTSNSSQVAQLYFDEIRPGSSSTLMLHFDTSSESAFNRPFVIGDLDSSRTFVHVFDQETLLRVISELGTISDLIHYLTVKVEAIRSGKLLVIAGEEELLGFYLNERQSDGYGALLFENENTDRKVIIPEGEWRAFESSPRYRIHRAQLKSADSWAHLLQTFSDAITSGDTVEANDHDVTIHERALRIAASENRVSRAYLSVQFDEKYLSVPPGVRSSRIVQSLSTPGRVYVLVLAPYDPSTQTHADYRANRRGLVEAYAHVLPLKVEGVKEAVIVGAQTQGSGTDSEVMIYVQYDYPLDDIYLERAKNLMEEYCILDTVQKISLGGLATSPDSSPRKFGRNEPCLCGSGKKNKKCCKIYRMTSVSLCSTEIG